MTNIILASSRILSSRNLYNFVITNNNKLECWYDNNIKDDIIDEIHALNLNNVIMITSSEKYCAIIQDNGIVNIYIFKPFYNNTNCITIEYNNIIDTCATINGLFVLVKEIDKNKLNIYDMYELNNLEEEEDNTDEYYIRLAGGFKLAIGLTNKNNIELLTFDEYLDENEEFYDYIYDDAPDEEIIIDITISTSMHSNKPWIAALTSNGNIILWGDNPPIKRVESQLNNKFISIVAGDIILGALTETGIIYAWVNNKKLILGYDKYINITATGCTIIGINYNGSIDYFSEIYNNTLVKTYMKPLKFPDFYGLKNNLKSYIYNYLVKENNLIIYKAISGDIVYNKIIIDDLDIILNEIRLIEAIKLDTFIGNIIFLKM